MKIFFAFIFAVVQMGCSSSAVKNPLARQVSSAEVRENKQMDLKKLKAEAFARCQGPYKKTVIEPIPILDPPIGGRDAEGMVYQEELAVRTANLLDRDGFYFSPRPRAAVNTLPMKIFIDSENSGTYTFKSWDDANPDYSSNEIVPAIDKSKIPDAGKVLTEIIIGHRSTQGDYPQLFDLRSSAYVRFAGYPPEVTGASMRLAAHKLFSLGGAHEKNVTEDFPVIREIYMKVKNPSTANAMVLVESDLFCGALDLDMIEGKSAEIITDGYWYTRKDFNWKKDPHTGLVAYSSMLFKTEINTPETDNDEAHDSDTLKVRYADGHKEVITLKLPENGLRIRDLSEKRKAQPTEWILSNEDRNPDHYSYFAPPLGATNYNFRASYRVAILESNIKTGVSLYESNPDGEYGDNIVAVSTIRQDFKKAKNVNQAIHFKYKTTSFLPPVSVK